MKFTYRTSSTQGVKKDSKRLARVMEKVAPKTQDETKLLQPLFWHADSPELLSEILHSAVWMQV